MTFTLISGNTFSAPIGGTVSGTHSSNQVEVYNSLCNGVYYSSRACNQPAGTYIQCQDEFNQPTIYTTAEIYNDWTGQPIALEIFKVSEQAYVAAGSPPPGLVIGTCVEIIQACSNQPVSPPFPPRPATPLASPSLPVPPPTINAAGPLHISSYDDMVAKSQAYINNGIYLFLGNGPTAQYANLSATFASMQPYLDAAQTKANGGPFLAIWGGNPPLSLAPDLGELMQLVKQKYNAKLLAVISDGTMNSLCDICFIVPPAQRQTYGVGGAVVYSGVSNGQLIGGSRFYLSSDFTGNATAPRLLTSVFVVGGGNDQLAELKYANVAKVPWRYFQAQAGNFSAYGSLYGPVDSAISLLASVGLAVKASDGTYASVSQQTGK